MKELQWDKLSRLIILLALLIALFIVLPTGTIVAGESRAYMVSTISLQNRFTTQITAEDIHQAGLDYNPSHYQQIKGAWNDGVDTSYLSVEDDIVYSWYFGTYSFLCIPFKLLLKLFNLNQTNAFAYTNIVFYLLPLILLYKKFNIKRKYVTLSLLLIAFNPIILYLRWGSAEVLMFSLLTIGIMFFLNKQFRWAGFFISLCGTINVTIMIMGIVNIVYFFYNSYLNYSKKYIAFSFKSFIKYIFKDTAILALCHFPFVYYFLQTIIRFGVFPPQSHSQFAYSQSRFWGERFLAYLFDLNFGLFPFFSMVLIIFLILTIKNMIKRDAVPLLLIVGFLGVVFAYSNMHHINSGMQGIARYNAWINPIFLLYIPYALSDTAAIKEDGKKQRIFSISFVLSAFSSMISLLLSLLVLINNISMVEYMPWTKLILDNAPAIYSPYPYTFVSRTKHVGGGYTYALNSKLGTVGVPVIYSVKGKPRKALVPTDTAEVLLTQLDGNEEDLLWLEDKVHTLSLSTKDYQYLNFPKNTSLLDISIIESEVIAENFKVGYFSEDLYSDIYNNNGINSWIKPNSSFLLKNPLMSQNGIEIQFTMPNSLFPFVYGENIMTEIYINDRKMHTISFTPNEIVHVSIPSSQLEIAENDVYNIEILTNAKYDPAFLGDNDNTRILCLQLEYIKAIEK